jgi:Family of unknown function (DUF5946)
MTTQEQFYELSFYTLSHEGKDFIHQHAVDAYTAQTADTLTKPIAISFALAGLYLFIEKNFTGKQVQDAHVQMSKKPKEYPVISLPESTGDITVKDVLDAAPGIDRDQMIIQWCISVWTSFSIEQDKVKFWTEELLESSSVV